MRSELSARLANSRSGPSNASQKRIASRSDDTAWIHTHSLSRRAGVHQLAQEGCADFSYTPVMHLPISIDQTSSPRPSTPPAARHGTGLIGAWQGGMGAYDGGRRGGWRRSAAVRKHEEPRGIQRRRSVELRDGASIAFHTHTTSCPAPQEATTTPARSLHCTDNGHAGARRRRGTDCSSH